MISFEPIRKKVLFVSSFGFFMAVYLLLNIIAVISNDTIYVTTFKQYMPLYAACCFAIALARQKAVNSTIEILDDHIVGLGPFKFFGLQTERVSLSYIQIKSHIDDDAFESIFNKQVIKLGDEHGQHIRIIKSFYSPELITAIKTKLVNLT